MTQQSLEQDPYDLFRQAIVERSGEAWAVLYERYYPLLVKWSLQYGNTTQCGESAADIASWAMERAWSALTPARFARFGNVSALLAYLRSCVTAAMIDASRAAAARERAYQSIELRMVASPEQIALEACFKSELWQALADLALPPDEWIVLYESYFLMLAPRDILQRHPEQYADVAVVYAIKRNLIGRLERSTALQQLYREMLR